jgi:hypothetical protein
MFSLLARAGLSGEDRAGSRNPPLIGSRRVSVALQQMCPMPETDVDVTSADQIAIEATQCAEKLAAQGMPRDEAWRVVAIEVTSALHKLEMTVSEMRRLTDHH